MKRTPLRRVSKKRAKENRLYLRQRSLYLSEHPKCEYPYCSRKPVDIHHKNHREGKLLLDTTEWAAVCRYHHNFIHYHPGTARSLGLLK